MSEHREMSSPERDVISEHKEMSNPERDEHIEMSSPEREHTERRDRIFKEPPNKIQMKRPILL
jgi:hypothetical protein